MITQQHSNNKNEGKKSCIERIMNFAYFMNEMTNAEDWEVTNR